MLLVVYVGTLQKLEGAYHWGDWDPWVQTLEEAVRRPQVPIRLGDSIEAFLSKDPRNGFPQLSLIMGVRGSSRGCRRGFIRIGRGETACNPCRDCSGGTCWK